MGWRPADLFTTAITRGELLLVANAKQWASMAFSEFETKRLDKAVGAFIAEHRPPMHIRPQLDLAYRITGQSVESSRFGRAGAAHLAKRWSRL